LSIGLGIGLFFIGLVIGAVASLLISIAINKKGKKTAQDYMNKAIATAQEALIKTQAEGRDILLEAKEKASKDREFFEKEIKVLQADIKLEREQLRKDKQDYKQREIGLTKKEETLEKKLESIEQSKQNIAERQKKIEAKSLEIEQSHQKMIEAIEQVAKLTREEAKAKLIESIEEEAKKDSIKIIKEIENNAKEEADKKAREIITTAIQRCCVDHSAEVTVSSVSLPSDELKGRIIGREGRNIRALENATGIDLIVDDTPETIVLSGFDPVRREVARLTLEKLISDGRIHPSRIEELVEKIRKDLDIEIKKAGEAALNDVGIFGMRPELIKYVGRLKYRTSYGQNILKHSIECAHLAGMIAAELGADVNLAKRGAFLHDLGKSVDYESEGTHVTIGVDLAKKYKESEAVVHCIAAHHNDIEANSLEAIITQIADSISGSRPGARRESLDNYVKRLEKLEEIANKFKGVEKSFALQAGREIRIIVKPEIVDDAQSVFMAKEIAKQIESELEYPGQIKVNVIRELRSVEYAK